MAKSPKDLPSRAYRIAGSSYSAEAKAIGARIRAIRKSRKWTLADAAKHAGLRYQHIQQIETGLLNVTLITLIRLAEGLGVPVSAFFANPSAGDEVPRELPAETPPDA